MTEFEHPSEQDRKEEEQKRRAAAVAWLAFLEKLKRKKQEETIEQAIARLGKAEQKIPGDTQTADLRAYLDQAYGGNHTGDLYTRNERGQISFQRVYEFLIEDTPPGQELLLHNGGYPFPLRQQTNFLTYYAANAGYTPVGEPTILPKTAYAAQLPNGPAIFLQDPPRPEMQATQVRPLSTVRYVFSYPQNVAPRPSRPGASLSFLPAEQPERQRRPSLPTRRSASRP